MRFSHQPPPHGLLLVAVLATQLLLPSRPAAARKWTDVTGQFSVEAELLELKGSEVRLRRANGSIVTVPILKLSAADRAFLRRRANNPPAVGRGGSSVEAALGRQVRFERREMPLRDALTQLEAAGLQLFVDHRALEEAGLTVDAPVRLPPPPSTAAAVLDTFAADDLQLQWLVEDNVVVLTTKDNAADGLMQTRVYRLTGPVTAGDAARRLTADVTPNRWSALGGPAVAVVVSPKLLAIRHEGAAHRTIEQRFGKLLEHVEAPQPPWKNPVERALAEPTELAFIDTPLAGAAAAITKRHGISVVVDDKALADEGIDKDQPVTLQLKETPLRTALRLLVSQLDASWKMHGGQLIITTRADAESHPLPARYDVRRLARRPSNVDVRRLKQAIQSVVAPDSWEVVGGHGAIDQPAPGFLDVRIDAPSQWRVRELLTALEAAAQAR